MRIELGKINQSWGKQGENNSVELAVDVSAWKSEYPSGAPSAAYTRADGLNYVLPVVMDGNYAVCTLSRTETACAGVVRLQISWIQGELVAKTALFEGYIELGIVDDEEELDSPEETVLEQMQQYAAATAASASAAASSASAAQAAQTEAEAAQDAAEDAQSAVETAQGKAEAAQAAAETARDAAQTAQRAAEAARDTAKSAQSAAEAARDAASGSAQGAASSAIAASDSAEDARGYADNAQSSAQDAQTSAGNAQTAAGQAAGSATTAQGHAQTAQQAAQTAQDAAQALSGIGAEAQTLPPGSDATVTVQDGKIIYGIPAGQPGTGLPDATAEDAGKVPVVGADGSYALGEPVPEVDTTLTEAGAPADAAAVGEAIEAISPDDAAVGGKPWSSKQIIDVLCPPLEETGNPVQCYPVAGYPLGVKASWEPRQEGTGDPSPDNVRPIVGLDSVQVTRRGKNVLDESKLRIQSNYDTSHEAFGFWYYELNLPFGSYTVSAGATYNGGGYLWFGNAPYGTSGATGTWFAHQSQKLTTNFTFNDVNKLYVGVSGNMELVTSVLDAVQFIQIEAGSIPTAYEPYTGTTATLDLPSTGYGGEVDLATGEGVETWKKYEFTGNEAFSINIQIQQNSQKNAYQCTIDVSDGFNVNAPAVCNAFKYDTWSGVFVANSFSLVNNAGGVVIQTDGVQSVEEFTAYLSAQYSSGTPVTIAYKLDTPQPIQATGSQSLPALSGKNVLITNADSMTVTGRADPNHTIQTLSDRIAALESETIEGGTNA